MMCPQNHHSRELKKLRNQYGAWGIVCPVRGCGQLINFSRKLGGQERVTKLKGAKKKHGVTIYKDMVDALALLKAKETEGAAADSATSEGGQVLCRFDAHGGWSLVTASGERIKQGPSDKGGKGEALSTPLGNVLGVASSCSKCGESFGHHQARLSHAAAKGAPAKRAKLMRASAGTVRLIEHLRQDHLFDGRERVVGGINVHKSKAEHEAAWASKRQEKTRQEKDRLFEEKKKNSPHLLERKQAKRARKAAKAMQAGDAGSEAPPNTLSKGVDVPCAFERVDGVWVRAEGGVSAGDPMQATPISRWCAEQAASTGSSAGPAIAGSAADVPTSKSVRVPITSGHGDSAVDSDVADVAATADTLCTRCSSTRCHCNPLCNRETRAGTAPAPAWTDFSSVLRPQKHVRNDDDTGAGRSKRAKHQAETSQKDAVCPPVDPGEEQRGATACSSVPDLNRPGFARVTKSRAGAAGSAWTGGATPTCAAVTWASAWASAASGTTPAESPKPQATAVTASKRGVLVEVFGFGSAHLLSTLNGRRGFLGKETQPGMHTVLLDGSAEAVSIPVRNLRAPGLSVRARVKASAVPSKAASSNGSATVIGQTKCVCWQLAAMLTMACMRARVRTCVWCGVVWCAVLCCGVLCVECSREPNLTHHQHTSDGSCAVMSSCVDWVPLTPSLWCEHRTHPPGSNAMMHALGTVARGGAVSFATAAKQRQFGLGKKQAP